VGAGVYPDVPTACKQTIRVTGDTSPSKDMEVYQEYYPRYQALYPALSGEYRAMAGVVAGQVLRPEGEISGEARGEPT
jgi:xylulokinase